MVPRQLVLIALTLGLLFLGWGFDDLRGFFASPARAGLVVFVLASFAMVMAARLDVHPFRKGKQLVGRGLMAAWALGGIVLVWFFPFGDRRGLLTFADAEALRYAGLVLSVAGGTLRLVAVRTLGQQFSAYVTVQENHRLVETGIYGVIRHPMYLGVLLSMPGMALVFRSWLVVLVFVFTATFVLVRIRQEEKLLGEHFGSQYEAYRRRTWRLLPYVY